ncbi:MAG: hypothetical protein Q4E12_03340 [Coriobacteriia bacterium]|nr:hypothetical protein [Coriobacteriia bacterium]
MYENPASKTVKGLSIAVIVLSALGMLLGLLLALVAVPISQTIDAAISESGSITVEASTTLTAEEVDALLSSDGALSSLTEEQATAVRNVLGSLVSGDYTTLASMVDFTDATTLQGLVDLFASLTDTQIQDIATKFNDPTLVTSLQDLRDQLAAMTPSDVQYAAHMFEYLTPENVGTTTKFLTATMFVVLGVIGIIVCAISLIAGILALRNAGKKEKLMGAFVWTIIAAIVAFFSARIVSMILLIILAVFINKVRSGEGVTPPTAGYGATQGYTHGPAANPAAQPYQQPAQPVANQAAGQQPVVNPAAQQPTQPYQQQ